MTDELSKTTDVMEKIIEKYNENYQKEWKK